ncbi:MAG: hypothetical protein MK101_00750 [Phycisphaerales bacterium]|nr:hypothetical protein [Phycisphaerales bacterium]
MRQGTLCAGLILAAGVASTLLIPGERANAVTAMQQDAPAQRLGASARLMQKLMYTDIELGHERVTVRKALNQIEEMVGVRLKPLWMSATNADGINPEQSVAIADAKRPALDVIEEIIEQISAEGEPSTWQIRHGAFEISTKARLGTRTQQVREVIPVLDVIEEIPDYNDPPNLNLGGGAGGGGFGGGGGGAGGGGGVPDDLGGRSREVRMEELIELITTMVEPEAWERNGGTMASVRPWRGTLIIRAPRWVQRQLNGMEIPPPPPGRAPRGLTIEGSAVQVTVPTSETPGG